MINFTFKLEFARVIVNLRYDVERIIKNKIYNDFIRRASGIIVFIKI